MTGSTSPLREAFTRRWGCDGGRNLSGWPRTRAGLVLSFLDLARDVGVEEKRREMDVPVLGVAWSWSVRSVWVKGKPRGRRNRGIVASGMVNLLLRERERVCVCHLQFRC